MKTCQWTICNDLISPTYYACGKPAKFRITDRLRGKLAICGLHAHAYRRVSARLLKRYRIKRADPEPITVSEK